MAYIHDMHGWARVEASQVPWWMKAGLVGKDMVVSEDEWVRELVVGLDVPAMSWRSSYL